MVAHQKAGRYWADKEFVRSSWGQKHAAFLCARAYDAVAIGVDAASPKNAAGWRFPSDITEETVDQGNRLPSFLTSLGTESSSSKLDVAWECFEGEWRIAGFANSRYFARITWHAESPFKVQCVAAC